MTHKRNDVGVNEDEIAVVVVVKFDGVLLGDFNFETVLTWVSS